MKILFDYQAFEMQKFGGISRYFYELFNGLNKDNSIIWKLSIKYSVNELLKKMPEYENRIIAKPNHYENFLGGIKFRGKGRLYTIKNKIYPTPDLSNFNQNLSIKEISKGDYDIFHPTYYDPYFLAYIDKPFILTVYDMIHELFPEYFPNNDKTSSNKFLLCNKAAMIIAISAKTKSDLIDIFGIEPDKIKVIHLASNFHEKTGLMTLNFEIPSNYILYTGDRSPYKNFQFFIRAIAPILQEYSHIFLVCTALEFAQAEIDFFKELNIDNKVKHVFLTKDEELFFIYERAICFVFPSLYEGFGFPILEAFAAGCPVICSNTGSLPEIAGDAAFYFNPKNIIEIRNAIQNVILNQAVRNDLILKGKKRYNDFNWEKCVHETEKLYQKVLHK